MNFNIGCINAEKPTIKFRKNSIIDKHEFEIFSLSKIYLSRLTFATTFSKKVLYLFNVKMFLKPPKIFFIYVIQNNIFTIIFFTISLV